MKIGNNGYTSNIFVNGKRVWVGPRNVIGQGGEADVYDIGQGQALKLYKTPDHPDFAQQPEAAAAAQRRLDEQQQKLPLFPRNLPASVIAPGARATADAKGQRIVGYTMPLLQGAEVLLRYGDRTFRESGGISHTEVTGLFRKLRETVVAVHAAGVVIGDFNDLNVLVDSNGEAFLIDADSFQYGAFLCNTFTTRFLDPILCDSEPMPARPHSEGSDWYAFCVMLMQCLLYVDPYGGLYRPKDPARRIAHNLRPLQRITVFHPEVRYPKPALPYGVLPDELLHFFHGVFEADRREPFPSALLDAMRWSTCKNCGIEHARLRCPNCGPDPDPAIAAVEQTIKVRGLVTATRFCQTTGVVLLASYQNGALRTLIHENGSFRREDGSVVAQGELSARSAFRLNGEKTLIGRDGQVITLHPSSVPERLSVDGYRTLPVFETNGEHMYWLHDGQLWRSGRIGPEYIGDVLAGQTQFWCGPQFGFGYYRAGAINVAFVFDANEGGLNDSVLLPPLNGQMYEATCAFTATHCWFFAALQTGAQFVHRCFVIGADGVVVAEAQAEAGDGSWLGSPIAGKCGAGSALLVPTDDGIARVECAGGNVVVLRTFPDTEPFVHAGNQLIAGDDGIYVVSQQEINLLTMK